MRPPDKFFQRFPSCIRCGVYMLPYAREAVTRPDGIRVDVVVYECPSCGKLAAEEIEP